MMSATLQDLRYALRLLCRRPWASATAVLALALGIGANSAIFSLINALLLRPLPYPDADRIAQVEPIFQGEAAPATSEEKFLFWRRHGGAAWEAMAAYSFKPQGFLLQGEGPAELATGSRTTWEFFPVFGVRPVLGRAYSAAEDRPGGPPVVVLGDGLWRRRFGADPAILGRQVRLDGTLCSVIGVMPPGFQYPADAQLWMPFQLAPESREQAQVLSATVRLKPGRALGAARAELAGLHQRYVAAHGGGDAGERITLLPLQEFLNGQYRRALLVLQAAVALVLLIACANVANLHLARVVEREREMAVRLALGASFRRVVRQLLTESLLLATLGGGAGLLLSWLAFRPLWALAPAGLAPGSVPIDGRVLAFTLEVALLTGLLCGLLPVLQARRIPLHETVKEATEGAGGSGGTRGARARFGLIVVETALAVVLLIAAGLLIRSFAGLRHTDPGFDAGDVLTLKLPLPPARYATASAQEALQRDLTARIGALPGVRSAAVTTSLPFEQGAEMTFVLPDRYTPGSKEGTGIAQYRGVSPGLFRTLGIAVLRGRGFAPGDAAGGPGVVILNESAARHYFPGQDPIGRRITIGLPDMPEQADPAPREVVGIARDVRELGLDSAAPDILYVPLAQVPPKLSTIVFGLLPLGVVVKGEGSAGALARSVADVIRAYDPNLPVTGVRTLGEILASSIGSRRFNMLLLGTLAALALVLATVGVYGVLAYLVARKTREIGIRLALGGDRGDILRLVVRQGFAPVGSGIVLGALGALAASRALASFLYGVSASDPASLVAVVVLVTAVGLLATYLPARRASRLNPMEALRHE